MKSMRFSLAVLVLSLFAAARVAAQTTAAAPQGDPVAQENAVKAKTLVNQAIQALGGQAYLDVKNMSQQGRTYSFHRGEATNAGVLFWRFVKFPDRERIELTKQRDISYVYNGDKGYEVTFKGTAMLDQKTLD